MCGICGFSGIYNPDLLKSMSDVMHHRGPDDSGTWYSQQDMVGLGHCRLSIIDLSRAGHQPMSNADETIWMSYNGEIYNFQEYREKYVKQGHQFRGHSDSEVLLCMYEEYGVEFLNKLNGIFAVAIWDGRTKELILARDHVGVKPIYYWQNGQHFYFASEIKALMRVPEISRRLNENSISTYLTLMWVPGEETMLQDVFKVEPGHYLVWKDGKIREKRQWYHLYYQPDYSICEDEWIERIHDTFMRTTRRQMVSDVPLGAFLSGGLDSSAIVACMRNAFPSRPITCYTMCYGQESLVREGLVDDFPYATRVAEHLSVDLKHMVVKPDVVNLLPKIVYHMDEPDSDPTAIVTYLVSKLARDDNSTVLLSGTGGDEIFFGYRSHLAYRQYQRLNMIPGWLLSAMLSGGEVVGNLFQGAQGPISRRIRKFRNGLIHNGLERHMRLVDWSSFEVRQSIFSPEFIDHVKPINQIPDCMRKYYDEFSGQGDINRHSHVLIQSFLAAHNFLFNDKCAMATSIEVRVPFMDVELMKLAATIPEKLNLKGNVTKYLLKKAMERYLPKDVIYRPKTGFSPPLREWVVNGLEPMINEYLSEGNLRRRRIFSPKFVTRILKENRENIADHGYLIYALLNLEIWQQTFIDRPGVMC